jgi:hypothetical protein
MNQPINESTNAESWASLEKAIQEATEIKTPEMTIDLPNDQKLTFGNLKPNTIVEIATWRGVGAPDDQSVRMLIGASLQQSEELPQVMGQLTEPLGADDKKSSLEANVEQNLAAAPLPTSEDPHLQLKRRPTPPPSEYQKINPELSWVLIREAQKMGISPFRQELTRKNMKVKTMKKSPRNAWFGALGVVASIGLIIGGLNVSGVLAFDHPQVGPDLPFGNATSSLVAIVPDSEPSAGDLAMATLDGKRNLVRVDAVSNGSFSIATMAGSMEVTLDAIDGKVSFVVPFVGVFWTLIGQ